MQLEHIGVWTGTGKTWGNEWDLVFTTGTGQPLADRNVARDFLLILKRAELENISLHDLRHLHASILVAQGVHMKAISSALGHSQINTTMDLYSHTRMDIEANIASTIQTAILPTAVKNEREGES